MIVAVFSDVHGNLPALEAFKAAVAGVADAYLCLGDIVNYGPWSDECLEQIVALPGIRIVAGNHDRMFLDGAGVDREAPVVQQFYYATRARFTRFDLLRDLPDELALGPFRCMHTIDGQRIFADSQVSVTSDYLIGHSHWQYAIHRDGWRIVNPGSVGQNRERIDMVDYALYDTAADQITLVRVPYDIRGLMAAMTARDFPAPCLAYYRRKLAETKARADESAARAIAES